MSIEAIVQDLETVNTQLADVRARLVAERKKHEAAIKSIDTVMASMPAVKAVKSPASPAKPETKQPSIGESVLEVVRGKPGVTTAEIAAALPDRNKKSIENALSHLNAKGALTKQGKGYVAAVATAAE